MNFSGGRRALLCFFLAIIKDTFGQTKPSNAVADVGGQVIFNCSGTSFLPNWAMSKDGNATNQLPIAGSCNLDPNLQNHYKIEQIGGPTTCNLIVFNITMEQAGAYSCSDGVPSYALLTVIVSTDITFNSTATVVENDTLITTCTLRHNGSVEPAPTLRPYFYWTDYNGQNVSSSSDSTTNITAVSQLTVSAGRQDVMLYTCHVYMHLKVIPPADPNYDTSTPAINKSASTPTYSVLYTPLISNILSEGRNASNSSCGISTVICIATANPTADYTWIDIEEPSKIMHGQSYEYAQFGRSYNCSAANRINDKTSTDVKTHEVRDQYSIAQACKGCHASNMNITGQTCTNRRCTCMFDCNMTMVCDADAYPDPTYQWKQGGRVIKDNSRTLDAVPDGTYSCVATNFIDGQPFEAQIDVDVFNCSPFTITLIVLLVWLGCCTLALCATALYFHSKGGFKLIMGCSFPFLCTKLESNKCLNALWIGLFILTSCISSGIAMALITCFCFNKKEEAEIKPDNESVGSGKIPTKSWIFVGISCILFLIVIILWIVAGVGISRCI